VSPEEIIALAKATTHFHQALLIEGMDVGSATSITGNFLLYFRAEILDGVKKTS
jgi:hypothetical protein